MEANPSAPWRWALPELGKLYPELPPAGEPPDIHPDQVFAALRSAASERAEVVLIVGWSPGAVALVAADTALARKDILWAVRPGLLRGLVAELEQVAGVITQPAVATYEERDDLIALLEYLPWIGWSMAVISDDPAEATLVRDRRVQRIFSGSMNIDREMSDLAHLLDREHRLGDAIPLSHWRGRWRGRTALCLAAGPSLDRWLPFVREHQDRCLVVVTDLIQHRLEASGVRVDFVINVDSHDLLAERIHAPQDPATVMVMPFNGHRVIDQRWKRRSYEGAGALADLLLGPDNGFDHGTNVGCATIGFAVYAGCSELVLIGHDLSFPPDSPYSSMVGQVEGVARNTLANRADLREIDGNDGSRVVTTSNFHLGVRDLGIMLGSYGMQGIRAYNLNIGTGVGALIANTEALPQGWGPAGAGACPRPGEAPTLAGAGRAAVDLTALLREQLGSYQRIWQELSAGSDIIDAYVAIGQRDDAAKAHQLLGCFELGYIIQLFRLGLLPRNVATRASAAAAARSLAEAIARAIGLVSRVLDERDYRPTKPQSPYSEVQHGFFARIRQEVPTLRQDASDAALLPMVGRNWLFLRQSFPDLALPPPQSIIEGLHICSYLMAHTPPAYVRETLALVAIDESTRFGYAAEMAAAAGLVEGDRWLGPGEDHLAAPLAAYRLLRTGGGTASDVMTAARWSGCHGDLIPAVLSKAAKEPWRADVLAALVRDGDILVEDAIAERLIDGHPDVVAVCQLLDPHQQHAGTGMALAIARRFIAIRDFAAARRVLEGIPLLDHRTHEAWALRATCEHLSGNLAGVPELLGRIPSHAVRVEAFAKFLREVIAGPGWVEHLVGSGLEPIPMNVLAEALESALTAPRAQRGRLIAVVRAAWQGTRSHPGLIPSEGAPLDELGATLTAAEGLLARAG